MSRVHFYCYFL